MANSPDIEPNLTFSGNISQKIEYVIYRHIIHGFKGNFVLNKMMTVLRHNSVSDLHKLIKTVMSPYFSLFQGSHLTLTIFTNFSPQFGTTTHKNK